MLRIGAHMSVAGGVSKAVDRALVPGCEGLQIFTRNASQWSGKPLDPAKVRAFLTRIDQTGITPVVSHASCLINLATAFSGLRGSHRRTVTIITCSRGARTRMATRQIPGIRGQRSVSKDTPRKHEDTEKNSKDDSFQTVTQNGYVEVHE